MKKMKNLKRAKMQERMIIKVKIKIRYLKAVFHSILKCCKKRLEDHRKLRNYLSFSLPFKIMIPLQSSLNKDNQLILNCRQYH